MTTNFKHAATVNALVGNETNSGWEAADHQLKIIRSEWEELSEGVETRDLHETRDGIADVLFTVYGLAHRLGLDADGDYDDMMTSQWSKFDTTEDDALLTQQKYVDKGMAVVTVDRFHPETGEILRVTLSSMDQLDDKGRFCPKGKWLKSHRFMEPVFKPLPSTVANRLV